MSSNESESASEENEDEEDDDVAQITPSSSYGGISNHSYAQLHDDPYSPSKRKSGFDHIIQAEPLA